MNDRKAYKKPKVTTLEAQEMIELMGPAQGSGSGVGTAPMNPLETVGRSGNTFGR